MAETIKGINIKLSLDGQDLDNELKAINKDLREQRKDLRAINTNLRYDSSSLDLWKKKQTQLNVVIKKTEKRLETQNKKLEQAKLKLKLGTMSETEFRKLRRNVTYNEADLKRYNNELERTKEKIYDLGNLKFNNLAKIGSTLTKAITMPIIGAVTALSIFAKKGIDTADSISETAKRLRMSAESLQEWNYIAKLSGVELTTLEGAFDKVNSVIASIALGDVKQFAGIFHALGISMDEIEGKDTNVAFEIIRDALENVEDVSLRAALANKLFGDKIGSELLPILGLERDAIKDLKEQANEFGIITSNQIDTVGEFTKSMDELKQATTALSVEVAEVMVPAMSSLVNIVKNNILPLVKSTITWWKELDDTTKKIIATLIAVAAAVGPVLSIVGKLFPIIKGVVVAIKAIGAAGMIAGAGISAATLGIGALVAIVAVALLKNEAFKELLKKIMDVFIRLLKPIIDIVKVLMSSLMPILEIIINIFNKLVGVLVPIIELVLTPFIKKIEFLVAIFEKIVPIIEFVAKVLTMILVPAFKVVEGILNPLVKVLEKIIKFFEKIFSFFSGIGDKVNGALGNVGSKIGKITSNISGMFSGATDKVVGFSTSIGSKVQESVKGAIKGVKGLVENATKSVFGITTNVNDKISGFAKSAKSKVTGAIDGIGSFFSNKLNLRSGNSNRTSNTTNNMSTNNSITINTTSSKFDVDSINRALGGKFI